jgi:hypothetical protein
VDTGVEEVLLAMSLWAQCDAPHGACEELSETHHGERPVRGGDPSQFFFFEKFGVPVATEINDGQCVFSKRGRAGHTPTGTDAHTSTQTRRSDKSDAPGRRPATTGTHIGSTRRRRGAHAVSMKGGTRKKKLAPRGLKHDYNEVHTFSKMGRRVRSHDVYIIDGAVRSHLAPRTPP